MVVYQAVMIFLLDMFESQPMHFLICLNAFLFSPVAILPPQIIKEMEPLKGLETWVFASWYWLWLHLHQDMPLIYLCLDINTNWGKAFNWGRLQYFGVYLFFFLLFCCFVLFSTYKRSCPALFLTAASSFSHNPGNAAVVAQASVLYLYKTFFKFLRYC